MPEDSAFAIGSLLLAMIILLSLFASSGEHSAIYYALPLP
jgi:hypothetical protein